MAEAVEPLLKRAVCQRRGYCFTITGRPRGNYVDHHARFRLFGLVVSETKTDIECLLPQGKEERPSRVNAGDQVHKQTGFGYLGHFLQ